jgi:uncharacterized protein (DUF885 family)
MSGQQLGAGALILATLVTTGAAAPALAPAQDTTNVERLSELAQRYAGLAGDAGPEDPAALAGEFILLATDLAAIGRDDLSESARIDYDVLDWLLGLGIAQQLEPELTAYELALLRHTGERQDPATLHQLGLAEVARLRGAMDALVKRYDPDAELEVFLEAARTDRRLYATSRDDLVGLARATARRIRAALPELFHDIPTTDFQFVTPGDQNGLGYMAWYQGPGRGRNARGYVVLNPDPAQVPLFVLDALVVHEGMPGHHYQMAWTAESVDVPSWRRGIMLTVFVEGWGLYAESLGNELGVYRHPMSEFGRLNLAMWRAIRLVVDTGLHAFDWTPARATTYFAEHTALPRAQITVEIDRYQRNPGQAVAYKLGEQRILAMRARAEHALGPTFDVRDFHRVLHRHGPVPMGTLDEIVDAWIVAQQTAPEL